MWRVAGIVAVLLTLGACGGGREMLCSCEGSDVLEGPHPANPEYGTCAESSLTCWVTAAESEDECTEADEASEQEAVCCEGEDCSCSCVDAGPVGAG